MTRAWLLSVVVAGCAAANNAWGVPDDGAVDSSGTRPDGQGQMSACAMRLGGMAIDFEADDAGWTHAVLDDASAPGWPLDEWQHGTATTGPGGCHGGTKCWATRVDANYTSCSRAALTSPAIDLSGCAGQQVALVFWSWHDFWTGTVSGKTQTWFDGGIVEVSTDGSTWSAVTPSPGYSGMLAINPNISSYACVSQNSFHVNAQPGFVGASGGWQQITVPLPAAVVSSTFQVRFAYSSGVSYANGDPEIDRTHTRPGWYIDDISFVAP